MGYAFLELLNFRAFYSLKETQSLRKIFIFSFTVSFLYAITDEIHQVFVPTRNGTVRDIFIDTVGIAIMYTYLKNNYEKVFGRVFLT